MIKVALFATLLMICQLSTGQFMKKPSNYEISELPVWAMKMYSENPNMKEVQSLYSTYFKSNKFIKSYHTQYYKRWVKQFYNFLSEDGYIQFPTIENQAESLKKYEDQLSAGERSGELWSLVGPISVFDENGVKSAHQANIYCIDRCEANPDVMYCGTEPGEVYKSLDAGENWSSTSMNTDFGGGVKSVEVNPSDPDIVFASNSNYLFQSIDGGLNWNISLTIGGYGVNEIFIHPDNTQKVFVGCEMGLFRSDNGGSDWTTITTDPCYDIKTKPGNNNIIYLLKGNPNTNNCEFFKSIDAGLTFDLTGVNWYSSNDLAAHDGGGRLAISANNPNRVYAYLIGESKADDIGYIGVFRSDDEGENWVLPNGPTGGPYDDNHINLAAGTPTWPYHQGFYNCAMMANPNNADEIIVGGLNLFKSTDAGLTFTAIAGYVGGSYDIHVDMQDFRAFDDATWLTCDGGIYKSDDFFSSDAFEVKMDGVNATEYWGFGSGWNEDVLVGGLYHNGNIAYYENYPSGQFLSLGGGEERTGYVNPGDDRKTYYSDVKGKYLPENIGDPVSTFGFGIFPNESYYASESSELEFDPRCYNTAFIGKDHQLWKTEDGGASFSPIYTFGSNQNDKITFIEISRSNPNVMYLNQQSSSGIIWKTEDGGNTWNSINLPSSGGGSTQRILIQLNPENENDLYIAYPSGSNGFKVYRSENSGSSWTNLTSNLLDGQSIHSIALIPATNGGIYACTNRTVYYRSNNSSWILANEDLPAFYNSNIARPFFRDGKIRLASYGKGIWESPLIDEPNHPIAQIMVDQLTQIVQCEVDSFYFSDYSIVNHSGANWQWNFEGGSPSTSNELKPVVYYDGPGIYNVLLTVTDASGNTDSDSLQIVIESYEAPTGIQEDFETVFPSPYFEIINPDNGITWTSMEGVGGYGLSDQCTFIDNFNNGVGELDDLHFRLDLSSSNQSNLSFDVAYARYASNYTDSLEVLVSIGCTDNFESLYLKGSSELATAPDSDETDWVPQNDQWRTDSVDLSQYDGESDLVVVFRSRCGWGQKMYLDNINLSEPFVSVEKNELNHFDVYPNPVVKQGVLSFDTKQFTNPKVLLMDLNGREIDEVDLSQINKIDLTSYHLASGAYILYFQSDQLIERKVITVQ